MQYFFITAFLVVSLAAVNAQFELLKYPFMSESCPDTVRRTCLNESTKRCEAVYVAPYTATAYCRVMDIPRLKSACGSANPVFYNSERECRNPKPDTQCPMSLDEIKPEQAPIIYSCQAIHKTLCAAVCGPRYDYVDIRDFNWNNYKSGLLCLDGNNVTEIKNGSSLLTDRMRQIGCKEIHRGNDSWCLNYGVSYKKTHFGGFMACGYKM